MKTRSDPKITHTFDDDAGRSFDVFDNGHILLRHNGGGVTVYLHIHPEGWQGFFQAVMDADRVIQAQAQETTDE